MFACPRRARGFRTRSGSQSREAGKGVFANVNKLIVKIEDIAVSIP